MSKADFKAVILAGGSGERFWPLSTPERPKQFLRVFGGESLIRQALARLDGLVSPEDAFVVTTKSLVAATRKELPEVPKGNIVGEPMRRDTGAAVALGVGLAIGSDRVGLGSSSFSKPLKAHKPTISDANLTLNDPNSTLSDPVVGFFSSDQMVAKPKEFRKAVKKAVAIARRKDAIVTIGIKPDYPATCFGYISPKTRTFVEKPDAEKAKKYVKAGYLWNAGMFIARASVFRGAFAAHAPELECLAKTGSGAKPLAPAILPRIYAALPKISFDYAVMEKAKNVEVVPGDFGWDDVGSFAAFDRYFPHDARGNVREGPCNVIEADGNICVARSARISLLGVKNLVVVTTPDAVLVADKSRLTDMKRLFAKQ
jgi:mannose-1-phosphate guanylyltransferase